MANRLDAMNPAMNSTSSVSQAKAANSASRPATNNQNVIKRFV